MLVRSLPFVNKKPKEMIEDIYKAKQQEIAKLIEKMQENLKEHSEKFDKDTKVAMIPIGYWHGYPLALSGIGRIYVGGVSCKVLGRVCMDIIMIDVTEVKKLEVGQEVEIMSREISYDNSGANLADLAGTTTYEFLTRINPLIKRIYK